MAPNRNSSTPADSTATPRSVHNPHTCSGQQGLYCVDCDELGNPSTGFRFAKIIRRATQHRGKHDRRRRTVGGSTTTSTPVTCWNPPEGWWRARGSQLHAKHLNSWKCWRGRRIVRSRQIIGAKTEGHFHHHDCLEALSMTWVSRSPRTSSIGTKPSSACFGSLDINSGPLSIRIFVVYQSTY